MAAVQPCSGFERRRPEPANAGSGRSRPEIADRVASIHDIAIVVEADATRDSLSRVQDRRLDFMPCSARRPPPGNG